MLSTFVVNSTADNTTDDGDLTLREAILAANGDPANDDHLTNGGEPMDDGDRIEFNIATADPTIELTLGLGQLPTITDDLVIDGTNSGGGRVTVDGAGDDRVFAVAVDGSVDAVAFSNLTITGGERGGGAGLGIGGGSSVTIHNSTITGNQLGGGIFVALGASLTIENSTISENTAVNADGGGIFVQGGASLTIENSTISGNTASGNTPVGRGGGVFNSSDGTLTVINSTISGNSAERGGGGIGNEGTLVVANSTITANRADSDGNGSGSGGGLVTTGAATLNNTIVAGNVRGADGDGETQNEIFVTGTGGTASGSHNLIGDAATAGTFTDGTDGNIVGADPKLGPLQDNGGPTETHALLEGSPAIDAGFDAAGDGVDQRGLTRPVDQPGVSDATGSDGSDIGAFELQVESANQAPVLDTEIPDLTVDEDASDETLDLDAFFSDPDVGDVLSFEVSGNTNGDLVAASVDGSTLTLDFQPDENGTAEITVTATDLEGLQVSDTFQITVNAVNDAPVNTVPGAQTALEDQELTITGISVFDVDAGEGDGQVQVTLSVDNGTLRVDESAAGGVSAGDIAGNGSGTVVLSGTQSEINATLGSGVIYLGDLNFSGLDTLTVTTDDLGNFGSGGALSDTDTVQIDVLSAEEQAAMLQEQVETLVDDGVVNQGQGKSLSVKLDMKGNRGDTGRVQGFVNHVNALLRAGILTEEEADSLLEAAESLLTSLRIR